MHRFNAGAYSPKLRDYDAINFRRITREPIRDLAIAAIADVSAIRIEEP